MISSTARAISLRSSMLALLSERMRAQTVLLARLVRQEVHEYAHGCGTVTARSTVQLRMRLTISVSHGAGPFAGNVRCR